MGTTSPSAHRVAGGRWGRGAVAAEICSPEGKGRVPQGAGAVCGGSGTSYEVQMVSGVSGWGEGLNWCCLVGAEGSSAGLWWAPFEECCQLREWARVPSKRVSPKQSFLLAFPAGFPP